MKEKFIKRSYENLKDFRKDRGKAINHLHDLFHMEKSERIDKAFSERINLAVTQVNGCKMCSYAHAESALKTGMVKEEVESLLSGSFDNVPTEQMTALLFAQHYAETRGNPSPETWQEVINTYGFKKSKNIMAHISVMMLSNMYGNTMEAFKLRLKGKAIKQSNLWKEIYVIIGFYSFYKKYLKEIGKKRKIKIAKS